jgi:hypothetical protein
LKVEVGGEYYLFMTDLDGQDAWHIIFTNNQGRNDVNVVRRLLELGGERTLFFN